MNEHVTDLLGAYLDDELEHRTAEHVRSHLADCDTCRKELADLEGLSGLLHTSVAPAVSTSRFSSRLIRQLPPRLPVQETNGIRQAIWWIIPVVVLILGFMNRMVINLSELLLLAGQAGYLGDVIRSLTTSEWLMIGSPSLANFLVSILNETLEAILPGMGTVGQVAGGIMEELAWMGALLLVCTAGLVAGWNRRSVQNKQSLLHD
jgi:anti-sigma factor RsiW